MKMLRNMKTGAKLALVLVLNVLLMMLMGWLGYSSSRGIQTSLDGVFDRDFKGIELLLQADRDLHQMRIAERSMMFMAPDGKGYGQQFEDYETNLGQAETRMSSFGDIAATKAQKDSVAKFFAGRTQWEDVSREALALTKSGSPEDLDKARELSVGQGKTLFEAMRDHLDGLTEVVGNQGKAAQSTARDHFSQLTLYIILLTVGSILPRRRVHPAGDAEHDHAVGQDDRLHRQRPGAHHRHGGPAAIRRIGRDHAQHRRGEPHCR
ncbi:MAG: MCP four helix bundle domain-containing protein [Desulfovibrionaceae bacterium]